MKAYIWFVEYFFHTQDEKPVKKRPLDDDDEDYEPK